MPWLASCGELSLAVTVYLPFSVHEVGSLNRLLISTDVQVSYMAFAKIGFLVMPGDSCSISLQLLLSFTYTFSQLWWLLHAPFFVWSWPLLVNSMHLHGWFDVLYNSELFNTLYQRACALPQRLGGLVQFSVFFSFLRLAL